MLCVLIYQTLHGHSYVSEREGGICIMDESSDGKVKTFSATRFRSCILAVT